MNFVVLIRCSLLPCVHSLATCALCLAVMDCNSPKRNSPYRDDASSPLRHHTISEETHIDSHPHTQHHYAYPLQYTAPLNENERLQAQADESVQEHAAREAFAPDKVRSDCCRREVGSRRDVAKSASPPPARHAQVTSIISKAVSDSAVSDSAPPGIPTPALDASPSAAEATGAHSSPLMPPTDTSLREAHAHTPIHGALDNAAATTATKPLLPAHHANGGEHCTSLLHPPSPSPPTLSMSPAHGAASPNALTEISAFSRCAPLCT